MIKLEVLFSNDGARAARHEIRAFLRYESEKLAGEIADRKDTATPAYVGIRTILARLEEEIKLQDERIRIADATRQRAAMPSIKEARGR